MELKIHLGLQETIAERISEARLFEGEGAEALRELGVSVIDTEGKFKSFETVIFEVFKAFDEMGNSAQATAIATRLFGTEGVRLLEVMRELGREGPKFSLLAEQRNKIFEDFRTELSKLGATFNEVFSSIAEDIAFFTTPILRFLNFLIEKLKDLGTLLGEGLETIFGSSNRSAEGLGKMLDSANEDLTTYTENLENLERAGLRANLDFDATLHPSLRRYSPEEAAQLDDELFLIQEIERLSKAFSKIHKRANQVGGYEEY